MASHRLISVVTPVFDERESLEELVGELLPVMRAIGAPFEVIFVDDGSRDGGDLVLADLARRHDEIRVVRLRSNFGKGAALTAGFREARGEVVITIDADLQDDPAEIPRLLAALDDGADLVSGWKQQRNDPWNKTVPSRVFNGVARRASGVDLHDLNCGFKAYRADVVRALAIPGEMYRFIPVIAASEGFRVAEVPVNHRARRHGRSKYGFERYLRGLLDLITISFVGRYRHRPMHFFGGLGLLLFLVGVGISVYLTIVKILGQAIGGRPLLLLGVLLIVVGIQLFTIGLVSELIQRGRMRSEDDEATSRIERVIRGDLASEGGVGGHLRARLPPHPGAGGGPPRARGGRDGAAPARVGAHPAQGGGLSGAHAPGPRRRRMAGRVGRHRDGGGPCRGPGGRRGGGLPGPARRPARRDGGGGTPRTAGGGHDGVAGRHAR